MFPQHVAECDVSPSTAERDSLGVEQRECSLVLLDLTHEGNEVGGRIRRVSHS